jgi:HSP20 family protein
MFDDVIGSMLGTATSKRTFEPDVDVHATENEVVFTCDVPGVKKEDLEITLENHVLTIRGSRKFDSKEEDQVILGRAYGSFNRVFTLPDYLDDSNLAAQLTDGVLTLRIPRHAKAKPRKIQIGGSDASNRLHE